MLSAAGRKTLTKTRQFFPSKNRLAALNTSLFMRYPKPLIITLALVSSVLLAQSWAALSTKDNVLRLSPFTETVLAIRGVPQRADGQHTRPETPDKVDARLWTKDGRQWVARWEEVK